MKSWNPILCLLLLRIWFIFVLSLALKYSIELPEIRGGLRTVWWGSQWVHVLFLYSCMTSSTVDHAWENLMNLLDFHFMLQVGSYLNAPSLQDNIDFRMTQTRHIQTVKQLRSHPYPKEKVDDGFWSDTQRDNRQVTRLNKREKQLSLRGLTKSAIWSSGTRGFPLLRSSF